MENKNLSSVSFYEIKKDLYNLNYSNNFDLNGTQEENIDIDLSTADIGTCSVAGIVEDNNGNPVPGCTIKLFDSDGKPFMHTVTNEYGKYTFSNLSAGNYAISCVKEDIVLTVAENIFLQEGAIKTHNFLVYLQPSINLCTISGIVLSFGKDNVTIEGASISLVEAITKQTIATTISANDGEYIFYDIPAGEYFLIAAKQGYEASSSINIIAKDNELLNIDIKLNAKPIESLGTISGIVSHKGVPVPNAFVGLFKTDEEGKERLIATTKTNAIGAYMFGKVETGNYKVKAKANK